MNEIPGLDETDVSGEVTASAPIVVERAMYRNLSGQPFGLGHDSMGVTATATSWFLAEGATGAFFDLYLLIANPGSTSATVRADYARPDGSVVTQTYTVRANSRFSVYVDSIPGLESTSVATTLTSTNGVPVVAERAMYWPGGFFDYYEGHSSAGSTTTALDWVVSGGENGGAEGAQTFVLIANTANSPGEATITVLPDRGFPARCRRPSPCALPAEQPDDGARHLAHRDVRHPRREHGRRAGAARRRERRLPHDRGRDLVGRVPTRWPRRSSPRTRRLRSPADSGVVASPWPSMAVTASAIRHLGVGVERGRHALALD